MPPSPKVMDFAPEQKGPRHGALGAKAGTSSNRQSVDGSGEDTAAWSPLECRLAKAPAIRKDRAAPPGGSTCEAAGLRPVASVRCLDRETGSSAGQHGRRGNREAEPDLGMARNFGFALR